MKGAHFNHEMIRIVMKKTLALILLASLILQNRAPAAGTGVAGAGAVGVDGYCFHGRPPWWVFELVPWSRDQCDSGRDLPAG